jgi:hypothetical protein
MLKWIITCVVVILGLAFMWYMGVLQEIGGAFKGWLRWIGSY